MGQVNVLNHNSGSDGFPKERKRLNGKQNCCCKGFSARFVHNKRKPLRYFSVITVLIARTVSHRKQNRSLHTLQTFPSKTPLFCKRIGDLFWRTDLQQSLVCVFQVIGK